ncbi:MAG: hypothetical protein OEZ13_01385 [Spirochaetia bacterium]|nr:hypothetical protein [Spirochaetia bacterium]
MSLICVILPWQNLAVNLAAEEYFLVHKEKDESKIYLFFYENFDAIVLGKTLNLTKEVWLNKKNLNILRRISGGGSVAHFKGNLNYAIFLSQKRYPELFDVNKSYKRILGAISTQFANKVQIEQKGLSDLSVIQKNQYRKVSGNSQARKRGWILHHGTFLYDKKNISKISYYLKEPDKQPDYRNKRSHNNFMPIFTPVSSRSIIIKNIIMAFSTAFSLRAQNIRHHEIFCKDEIKAIRQLSLESYLKLV